MRPSSNTLGIVMAGGIGARLGPLTADRAKPAVPFGGQYRIIDFTLANCVNSGLRNVLVLTQYKSQSLLTHLQDTWDIVNPHLGEYITAVPPQMRTGDSWYCGTANAVYQNLYLMQRSGAKNVVILSGDHVYRMDYFNILRQHEATSADVTVACLEVGLPEARSFGIVGLDAAGRISDFQEKPTSPRTVPDNPDRSLASMGIYVFSMVALRDALVADHEDPASCHDFGKDVIPRMIRTHAVYGYRFDRGHDDSADRYWKDVGTVDAYYEASMDLLKYPAPLNLYNRDWPVRRCDPPGPPALIRRDRHGVCGEVHDSILGRGAVVTGGHVSNSILSAGSLVASDAVVSDSILFDDVEVGEGAVLQRCIVDKGVRIPPGVRVGLEPELHDPSLTVSESGIVVVPKGHQFCQDSCCKASVYEYDAAIPAISTKAASAVHEANVK